MYDFHKIKSKDSNNQNNNNSIYEFTNVNFLKNDPEKINLIKRKAKNDNMPNKILRIPLKGIKGNELIVHSQRKFLNLKSEDKKKLNLKRMYKKALKLSEIVSNLRKKVEVLQGKYDFLEYCNYNFEKNNKDILNKLQKILDKKKTLESLFFSMIRNFFPNIKIVENTLNNTPPSTSIQTNNQIHEIRNNEIITQIYKIFNLNDNNISNNNISDNATNNNKKIYNSLAKNNLLSNLANKNNNEENKNGGKTSIVQLMDQLIDKEQFNVEAREINTYNKIIDFQKKYFADLDEQNNTKNKSNYFDKKDKFMEKDNNSINSLDKDNIKNDLLTISSNNNSTEIKNNQFLSKKTIRDADNSISDGSKDLL